MVQTSWTDSLSGICFVVILFVCCFSFKTVFLAGYPAGYPAIRPTGYPANETGYPANETGYPAGYRISNKAGYPAGYPVQP